MEGGARGVAQRAWAAEAQRLAAQAARLEAEVRSALSADNPCRAEVERETLREEGTRLALARELGSRADAARRGVAALGDLMEAASAGGDGAAALLARLTREMDDSEAEILALKESSHSRFEVLLKEEADIEAELSAFEQRRARWETESAAAGTSARGGPAAPPSMVSRAAARASAGGAEESPPEVQAYDDFVATKGQLGGWDEADHEMFMKQLKAAGGDYSAVVARASERLAHIPKQDVIAHARWHAEHEDLLAERRAAIQRWRLRRDMARLGSKRGNRDRAFGLGPMATNIAPESDDSDDLAAIAEAELRAREERELAAEVKRAEVRAWKAEKAARDRDAMEEQKRLDARRAQAARASKEANAVRRAAALEYRARREAAAAARKAEELVKADAARAARPKLTKEDAMRMHERDLRMVERKAASKAAKREEEQERARRLERMAASVRSEVDKKVVADKGRVLRPTSAQARRVEALHDRDRGLFNDGTVNVRHHEVRATPSWRQLR